MGLLQSFLHRYGAVTTVWDVDIPRDSATNPVGYWAFRNAHRISVKCSFRTWFAKRVHWNALNLVKASCRSPKMESIDVAAVDVVSTRDDPSEAFWAKHRVDLAINSLPEPVRNAVLIEMEFPHLPDEEKAELVGTALTTMKKNLSRGRTLLRKYFSLSASRRNEE